MTDIPPPRPNPPRLDDRIDARLDGRPLPARSRSSQTSMWLVFLGLAAVILAAIAFSVDRSTSVVDTAPTEPAATATPDATEVVPAEPAPATTGGSTGGTTGTGETTTTP